MNSKILIAFIAGAVIASGIVYMAVKEEAPPKATAVSADVPRPAPPPPVIPVAVTAPVPPVSPAPIREKPSPMPPSVRREVRRERPVTVARNQDPPPRPEPLAWQQLGEVGEEPASRQQPRELLLGLRASAEERARQLRASQQGQQASREEVPWEVSSVRP